MPVFQYKNTEIYYDLFGNEGDPVITFINGLSMRTSHWGPYFKILPQKGVRVLTYDMLGQGYSSKPILGISFDDHAASLKALHDHLGIDQPYVMGISFGGVVALRYAMMYPDAIKGLIPISTFSELDPLLACHAHNLYMSMSRVGFEFYLDLLMPLNFTNEWLIKNQALLAIVKRVGSSSNEIFGIQNLMESLRTFQSITPELAKVKAPTLVLNGEYDPLTPRALHDIIRANTPHSRMLILQRMSHAFTLEIPELCSRIFAEFIEMVETGTWQGDQTVWVCNEDPAAPELAYQCPGDQLRYIPQLDQQPTTAIKKAGWKSKVKSSTVPAPSPEKTKAPKAKSSTKAPAG